MKDNSYLPEVYKKYHSTLLINPFKICTRIGTVNHRHLLRHIPHASLTIFLKCGPKQVTEHPKSVPHLHCILHSHTHCVTCDIARKNANRVVKALIDTIIRLAGLPQSFGFKKVPPDPRGRPGRTNA